MKKILNVQKHVQSIIKCAQFYLKANDINIDFVIDVITIIITIMEKMASIRKRL